jgi:hypothetical protein
MKNQSFAKLFPVLDVSGGMRQDIPPVQMPDNVWYRMYNWEYLPDGTLATRAGQTKYNAIAPTGIIDNSVRYYNGSANTKKLVISVKSTTAPTKIYLGDDALGTFTEITSGTAIATASTCSFATFRNTLLITNGLQGIQYYTAGSTKQDCVFSDNSRKGKYIAVADYRVWIAGDPSAPNRVYVSELGLWATGAGTDCSFPNDSYIDVPGDDGDYIVGLAAFAGEIYVFCTKTVYVVYGDSPISYQMRPIVDVAGGVTQKGIVVTPYGIMFASGDSIWFFNPNPYELEKIGEWIGDEIASAVFTSAAGGNYSARGHAYMSFRSASTSATNDMSMVYDYKAKKAWICSIGASTFCCNHGTEDNGYFFRGSTTDGFFYQMDTGKTDDGTNIDAILLSKIISGGTPYTLKMFRQIWMSVYAETDTTPIAVTVLTNRGMGTSVLGAYTLNGFSKWGEFVFGRDRYGGGEHQNAAIPGTPSLNGMEFQIKFEKSNAYAAWLYDYEYELRGRPLRRR